MRRGETGRSGASMSVLVAASDDELRILRLLARLSAVRASLSIADDDDVSTSPAAPR